MTAYTTWPDGTPRSQNNAFSSVPPRGIDKPCTAPKKRGPKPAKTKIQQAAMALETPEERTARQQAEGERKLMDQQGRLRVDLAPRTLGAITIYSREDQNKSRVLAHGRNI